MASAKLKHAVKRIKAKLNSDYEQSVTAPTAGPVGSGKLFIGGQVFDGDITGITQVVNVGRPAAAQYAARYGGSGSTTVVSGGSTSPATGSTADLTTLYSASYITSEAEASFPNARQISSTNAITITDGGSGGFLIIGMATPPTLSVSSTNDATTGSHAIASSSNPGAAASLLASDATGKLTLPLFTATTSVTTPTILATGDITITPAGGDVFANARLDVITGSSGVTKSASYEGVAIYAASNAGLQLLTPSTGVGLITFGDPEDNDVGRILYRHSTNRLDIEANATLVMSATSSGVGFGGQTSPSYTVDITGTMRATTSLTTPVITTIGAGVDLTLSPIDDIILSPGSNIVKLSSSKVFQSDNYASQTTGMRVTHDGQADFRYLFVDEMHAKSFIADLEQALAGGQIIAKSVAMLYANFTAPAAGASTTLTVRDLPSATGMACFVNGDYIRVRNFSRSGGSLDISDCWGTVTLDTTYGTSGFDSSTKTQRYTFTRSTSPNAGAMSSGTVIQADAVILDYGTSGNGFYEVNAIDGMYGANSPYAQIVTWSGHPRSQTVRARLGNLYGIFASSGEYGLYAGDGTADTNQYLRISNSGVRLNNVPLRLHSSGVQTVNIDSAGTDIWVGTSSSDKRLQWNGSSLILNNSSGSPVITLDNTGASYFAGVMTIGTSGEIRQGTGTLGSNYTGLRIWRDTNVGRIAGYNANNLQWYADTDGKIKAGGGNVELSALGIDLQQDGYLVVDRSRALSWWPTISTKTGTPSQEIIGYYDAFSQSVLSLTATNATFGSRILLTADNIAVTGTMSLSGALSAQGGIAATGTVTATTGMSVGGTAVSLVTHNHDSTYLKLAGGQTLTGTVTTQTLQPSSTNTYNLGSSTAYYNAVYANSLYTNTIVGTPSYSHTHDAGDITTGTLAFARIPTTWTGALTLDASSSTNYVRWKTDTSKNWDLLGRPATYATTAQQNDLLLTYFDGATNYIVFQADSGTRIVDFINTPTVGGTAVSLSNHTHAYTSITYSGLTSGHFFKATGATSAGFSALSSGDITTALTYTPVDISTYNSHVANANAHHAQSHVLATTTGLGADHAVSGLTTGQVLRATGATTAQFMGLTASDITTALGYTPVNRGGDTMTGALSIQTATNTIAAFAVKQADATNVLSVDTTNARVGVGTGSPSVKLHLYSSADEILRIESSSATGNPYVSWYQAGTRRSFVQHNDTNENLIIASEYGDVSIRAAATAGTDSDTTYLTVKAGGTLALGLNTGGTAATVSELRSSTGYGSTIKVYRNSSNRWNVDFSSTDTFSLIDATTGNTRLALSLAGVLSVASITTGSGDLTLSAASGTVIVSDASIEGDNWNIQASGNATLAGVYTPLVQANGSDLTVTSVSNNLNLNGSSNVDVRIGGVSQWTMTSARLLPRSTLTMDIGDYNRRVRSLYAAELQVETLVAQNVLATIGGRIIVAPTVKLIADLANTGTATALNTNLQSWWALDEASGTRSDSRGSNSLTSVNSVASTTGKQSNAASFTGSSSMKLNRADNTSLSTGDIDFAFCAWVYPTLNSGARQTILCKGSTTTLEYKLDIDWSASGAVKWAVWNSSGVSTEVIGGAVTVNNWYFIIVYHDAIGNAIGVAVNGSETSASHTTGVRDSTGNFTLGARDTDQFYTGRIDEVAYWKSYIPDSHARLWLYNRGTGRTYSEINTQVSSTIDVDGNSLAVNDFAYMAAAPGGIAQIEAMRVYSSPSTISGGYRYTVIRNYDGTGLNSWNAGDAVVNLGGNAGEGYIDITSTSTIHGELGPTIAIYQRSGSSFWDETTPTVALGNLRSFVDYASDRSGIAIGNDLTLTPTTGFQGLTADATNGIRLFNTDIKLYNSGTQTVNIDNTGTNIWVGTSSADKRLSWDGSALTLNNTELKLYNGATESVRLNNSVGLRFVTGSAAINTVAWYNAIGGYDQAYLYGDLVSGTASLNLRARTKDVGTGAFSGYADVILSNATTSSSIKLLAHDGSVNGPNYYMTVAHTGVTINSLSLDMTGNNIVNIGTIGDVSTWTPAITFGGGSTGITYSSRTGRYVKIGKLVYASCEIRLSNKGSSTGIAKITGLPATSATTAAGGVPSIIWYQMATSFVHVSGAVDTAATAVTLVGYTAAAASYASITNTDFANNSIIQMTVMYEAA